MVFQDIRVWCIAPDFLYMKKDYFEQRLHALKVLESCFLSILQRCNGFRLSKEQLFIIIAQEAAELWPIKVGSPKKSRDILVWVESGKSGVLESKMSDLYSNLQLWQVKILRPLEVWWRKVAHLKASSHISLHNT